MNKMFPVPSPRRSRASVALLLAYLVLFAPLFPLSAQVAKVKRATTPQATGAPQGKGKNDVKTVALPSTNAPAALPTPNVTATKVDAYPDPNADGKADPGETITYTVTISNAAGAGDATGVAFNDTIDPNTTLVPGSVNTQPIAANDSYNVIGNVRIQPNAAAGLLANDCDPDNGPSCTSTGLTASGPTTSAQGGNVTINADGSFSYNPAPGFTGTDTFTYTVTDGGGKTDTAVATFLVGNGTATPGSNVVWFVNPSAGAGGDGRLTSPFNCYTGVAASCFSQTAADDPGDAIFLFTGAHTGGYALLANEKLIGQGATDTLANLAGLTVPTGSDALPTTGGTSPVITTTNANAVPLPAGAGNAPLLRGFTVGNTGTGAKISGTTFGTLTVGNNVAPDVILNGTGQALNLSTGAFAATSAFVSVATTSSAAQGVSLTSVSGTVAFGSTSVSGAASQGIFVGSSPANINFGNTSVTGGSDGVSFQSNSSGTRTFGTLGVSGGTGSAFLHSTGGGNVTVNGAATLASTGDVVNIANAASGTIINFVGGATVTKTSTGGNGVNWSGTNTGATLTFATLALTTSNGAGMNLVGGGAVNVTTGAGSFISTTGVTAQAAPAITASGVALGLNFTTVTVNGGGSGAGQGITLTSVTGALTVNNGGSTSTNIQNTGGAGINVTSSSATLNFGNTTVNATAGTGIILGGAGTGNSGAATFGALTLTPDSGQVGINAQQNTGTLNISSGTVTTTNATAVSIAGTSSASKTPLNVSLTTVNTTGGATAANGILLKFTSDAGNGFTVTGSGGTCTFASSGTCTGGHITNTSGADNTTNGIGVYLEDVADINLTRVHIDTHTNFAIRGRTNVAGFQLLNSVVDGNNGTSNTADVDVVSGEDSIRFNNLTGSALIDNTTIAGGYFHNLRVTNNTGTLNRLTVQNSLIGDPDAIGSGQRGLVTGAFGDDTSFEAKDGITAMNVTVQNSTLNFGGGRLFAIFNNDNAGTIGTVDAVVRNNTLVNLNPFATQAGASHIVEVSGLGNVTYEVACNKIANSLGIALLVFKGKEPSAGGLAANFSGTIFNNTVGLAGVAGSGGGNGTSASAINVDFQGTGTGTVLVKNNVVREQREAGIRINHVDTNNSTGRASTLNATVIGNTVTQPDQSGTPSNAAFANVYVNAGADPSTDINEVTNLKVGNASVAAEKNNLNDGDAITFDAYIERVAGTLNLSRAGSASSTPSQIIIDDNIVNSAQVFVNAAAVPVNTTPALPAAINETCTPPSSPVVGTEELSVAQPEKATAVAPPPAPALSGLTGGAFVPAPVAFAPFGAQQTAGAFAKPAKQSQAQASQAEPSQAEQPPVSKSEGGAKSSSAKNPQPVVTAIADTVSVNIGTLRAGDSVTITFQVTVNNPYTGGANVSNQGTVSGSNFSNVLTDDPSIVGAANPTLTPINSIHIRVNDAKAGEPTSGSTPMLFTVVLSGPAPVGGLTVNYATADGGANPATSGATACDGTFDYQSASGTLTFAAGESVKTIPVNVCADANNAETPETFLLNISAPSSGTIDDAQATGTIDPTNAAGTFLLTELRTTGPAGPGDDFVELYNNTTSPLTVTASDASAGYGVFKMGTDCNAAPVLIGTVPNNTVIPARGHYLLKGSQYSLSAVAAGDLTMTSDIETDHNVAVFSTADAANLSSVTRLDAVGFGTNTGGSVCDLLKEGAPLGSVAAAPGTEHSFFRKMETGYPQDTNDNASDFRFADTQGTLISGIEQRLGAPGPENLASPLVRTATIKSALLDACQASTSAPNRVRDLTPGPAATSSAGTLAIRRTFTNNTGAAVTKLRFRIVDVTTFPSPGGGVADLRAISSSDVSVNLSPACGGASVPVKGLTLDPPSQPNGGGYNSTVSAGTVAVGTPLAPGASISVQFLLGVQTPGTFRFLVVVEALP